MGSDAYSYDAFISYRHVEPDRRWAKWLHTSLETYRVPKKLVQQRGVAPRVGRVFRDEEELPASSDLNGEIERALRGSRFLIVVCSPRTPQSMWVNKEIERFREMGRHDRILALLIEGEPGESFPPALRGIRRTITDARGLNREQIEEVEPLAADVRPGRTERRGHLGRMAKLRLLACVLGCRFDDLRQREQERWRRRVAYLGVAAAVLLCVMIALTLFAFVQRGAALANAGEARRNATRADANALRATRNAARAQDNAREAERRLADALVRQGDALGLAGRWVEAEATCRQGLAAFRQSGSSPFPAEVGLWNKYLNCPPPLMVLPAGSGPVSAVALTADGRAALSGHWDGTLDLYDVPTGRAVHTFAAHEKKVNCIAVSPDGSAALSAGADGTLKLWDLSGRRQVGTLVGHRGVVECAAFMPGGRAALSGGADATLKLWDLATAGEIRTFAGHNGRVESVAVSRDGRTALSGSTDGTVRLWDLAGGNLIRTFEGATVPGYPPRPITSQVAFSANGGQVFSCGPDGAWKTWELSTGKAVRAVDGNRYFATIVGPDLRDALSYAGGDTLNLWHVASGRHLRTFTGTGGISFGLDGRTALSQGPGETLDLWDASGGRETRSFPPNSFAAVSPDGRTALSTVRNRELTLWDLPTGRRIRSIPAPDEQEVLAISPDGHTVLAGRHQTLLKLWDLFGAKEPRTVDLHHRHVMAAAFSPDGRTVLSGGLDYSLELWDAASGREIHRLAGHESIVWMVAFSPDGRTALSGGEDKTLRLWDLSRGTQIRAFAGHSGGVRSVAFSPDGRAALSGGDDHTIKLWDVGSGREVRTFEGTSGDPVLAVAFHPDGHAAISGAGDGQVKLWDVSSGRELRTLTEGTAIVETCNAGFSPDGRTAFADDGKGGARLSDFSRAARYLEFEPRLEQAKARLRQDQRDGAALGTLGEWWAFRGRSEWAVELLERARAGGSEVSPLTLGRCYWELSDEPPPTGTLTRAGCLAAARREFGNALQQSKDEQERSYLKLLLDSPAFKAPPTQPATAQR